MIFESLDAGTENAGGGEAWSGDDGGEGDGVPEFNAVTLSLTILAVVVVIFVIHRFVLKPQAERSQIKRN